MRVLPQLLHWSKASGKLYESVLVVCVCVCVGCVIYYIEVFWPVTVRIQNLWQIYNKFMSECLWVNSYS